MEPPPARVRRLPAVVLAAALGATACRSGRPPGVEHHGAVGPFAAANREIEARLRALPLAAPAGVRLRPVASAPRVVVTADGIDVDNAASVAAWSPSLRERYVQRVAAGTLPRSWHNIVGLDRGVLRAGDATRPGGYLIAPLSRAARELFEIDRGYARMAGTTSHGDYTLYVTRGVPTHTVSAVMYTLAFVGYSNPTFVYRDGDGGPWTASSRDAPADPRAPAQGPCLALAVRARPQGFTVAGAARVPSVVEALAPGTDGAPPWVIGLRVSTPDAGADRAQLEAPERAIPLRDGRFDLRGLGAAVDELRARTPVCPDGSLAVSERLAWADVLAVYPGVADATGLRSLALSFDADRGDEAP